MPEARSKFLQDLIDDKDTDKKSYTEERQLTAQSLVLHVDYRDGLSSEGTAWSHLARYKWQDHGSHESLRIVFGPACAMEIIGHNLGVLTAKMREGQLNGVMETLTGQAKLALHDGAKEPIITNVTAYPDFDQLFEAMKEEAKGEEQGENRHTRRLER